LVLLSIFSAQIANKEEAAASRELIASSFELRASSFELRADGGTTRSRDLPVSAPNVRRRLTTSLKLPSP
jgi:hypothetical protein